MQPFGEAVNLLNESLAHAITMAAIATKIVSRVQRFNGLKVEGATFLPSTFPAGGIGRLMFNVPIF